MLLPPTYGPRGCQCLHPKSQPSGGYAKPYEPWLTRQFLPTQLSGTTTVKAKATAWVISWHGFFSEAPHDLNCFMYIPLRCTSWRGIQEELRRRFWLDQTLHAGYENRHTVVRLYRMDKILPQPLGVARMLQQSTTILFMSTADWHQNQGHRGNGRKET